LTQAAAAQALGVHEMTVSRWERGMEPDEEQLAKAAAVYGCDVPLLRYGDVDHPEAPRRVPMRVGEAPASADLPSDDDATGQAERVLRSHAVRVWLADFRSELTRAHATVEEVERALALVSSANVLTFYSRGKVRALSEADAITALEAIAVPIRAELRRRGRKFA
jgi:transcriptional regulator with XRE-family HTH domain